MNFSDYARVIQYSLTSYMSDENLVNLLLCSVADPAGIKDKEGEPYHINKSTVSKLLNSPDDHSINEKILDAVNKPKVRKSMVKYFCDYLVPLIGIDKRGNLRDELLTLIKQEQFDDSLQQELITLSEEVNDDSGWGIWLARILQFVMAIESKNKLSKEEIRKKKRHPLKQDAIPAHSTLKEVKYVNALLEVYSEKSGNPIRCEEDLAGNKRFSDHFNRQRVDFYNAECVNRNCRELYTSEEENPFDVFVQDIYAGIIDTYTKEYSYGMERLTSVLEKATSIPFTRSILTEETKWIGPSEEKGICHMLVNDSRLEGWVRRENG